MFWRLLEREADWLPPWRDLLRVYRRLEARGEIRGGRFVAGFSGEQFALPDAIGALREVRRKPASGALVSLSGADPLNLAGILTPGPKLAALTGNRLLYRDGLPVALLAGGEVQFLETLDAGQRMGGAQGAAARRRAGSAASHRCGGSRGARGQVQAFRARAGIDAELSAKLTRRALPAFSMPLRELDGHSFRAVDEHQLAGMKIHDLVAGLEPVRPQLRVFSFDVADRKADVVHAELVQVADVRIGQGLGVTVAQQLDLRAGRDVLQDQRDVLGFDARNTHVARERLARDGDGHRFLEPQDREERLGALGIAHDDGQMVEMLAIVFLPARAQLLI